MLFDLRGAGRRNTVKGVYLFLALLMGLGLVGFGIGGSGLGGGLFDALSGSDANSSPDTSTFQKQADAKQRAAEAKPKDAAAWAEAARARYNLALAGDNFDANNQTFTDAGKAQLQIADHDWQKHLALNPDKPDDSVAGIMVKVYSSFGLNEPEKAVQAQEIITEARPKSATFATLAILAYQAGQTRKGDLAKQKALDLADPADRETLKSDLESQKQQALASQLQNSTSTATPTATATPKAGTKKKSGKKKD